MSKTRIFWAVALLVVAIVVGEFFAGFLTLQLLQLKDQPLRWDTYLSYARALNLPQVQEYAGRIRWSGYIGFGPLLLLWLCALYPLFKGKKPSMHGDARFAHGGDLRKQGMLKSSDNGILVGKYNGNLVRLSGQQFVILAAPTR